MQFSDTSNKQGIIQDITFLTGVDTNKYPLADRTRNVNEWMRSVWSWIFQSYGGWEFADDNQTSAPSTLPSATQNLTSGTGVYGLPSGALVINRVEILQTDGITWSKLEPIALEQIPWAEGQFLNAAAMPRFYRLVGDLVKLYPTPNYSVTNGIKVFFEQEMTAFTAADTTAVPGFASTFHRILSLGASYDYAMANSIDDKVQFLLPQIAAKKADMQKFYQSRFTEMFPTRIRVNNLKGEYR